MIEELIPTKVLRFNPNQLEQIRKLNGLDNHDRLIESLEHLENWIQKQNHFVGRQIGRRDMEHVLSANKGSLERTKKTIDKLFTLRNLMPELMQDFKPRTEFVRFRKYANICPLPTPTPEHYRVIVTQNGDIHDDNVTFINFARYLIVQSEYIVTHDYAAGYACIVDIREASFGILAKMNPVIMQKLMIALIEGYRARLQGIHLISSSKFVETIVAILKQAVSDKLAQRIHIHSTPDTLVKYFPRSILPSDFGGDERSIKQLSDETYSELCSEAHLARLEKVQHQRCDEDKRLPDKFTQQYCGLPGSFRALSVD